ncbi:MAG TPA: hypothetical protein VF884_14425 [Nitrososphaeraceae archaeon]
MVNHFPDIHEFKKFAINFIRIRTDSLKKDVEHCLSGKVAPFPAILYCVSTIDLLGALYAGQAKKGDPNSKNSKKYMIEVMNYTDEQATLISEIFRHKLVHLAQPHPVYVHNNKTLRWVYHHSEPEMHLILEDIKPSGTELILKSDWKIHVDQYFHVSIYHIMIDIINSVENHGGFLDRFENDSVVIQPNVKTALEQIYDPNL